MEKKLRLIKMYGRQLHNTRDEALTEAANDEPTGLRGYIEDLSEKWNSLSTLYDEVIQEEQEETKLEQLVQDKENTRSLVIQTRNRLDETLRNIQKSFEAPNGGASGSGASTNDSCMAMMMAKLTSSKVPAFAGDISKWPEFWSFFELSVHETALPVIEKFVKLKEALTGEAASIIEGLLLTETNYDTALELLKAHYGSKDVIIEETFRSIHNLPIVPPGNHQALKKFLIDAEVKTRSLQTLGVPYESYAISLVSLLVDRLPKSIRTAWYRQTEGLDPKPDVTSVLGFIRKEVKSHERSQASSSKKREADEGNTAQREVKKSKWIPSAAALSTITQSKGKSEKSSDLYDCVYCHKSHSPRQCELPLKKKKEIVLKERRCYVCLKIGHTAFRCTHPNPDCRKCKGRHHTSLCPEEDEESKQTE